MSNAIVGVIDLWLYMVWMNNTTEPRFICTFCEHRKIVKVEARLFLKGTKTPKKFNSLMIKKNSNLEELKTHLRNMRTCFDRAMTKRGGDEKKIRLYDLS